jgi:hypothetical protein
VRLKAKGVVAWGCSGLGVSPSRSVRLFARDRVRLTEVLESRKPASRICSCALCRRLRLADPGSRLSDPRRPRWCRRSAWDERVGCQDGRVA